MPQFFKKGAVVVEIIKYHIPYSIIHSYGDRDGSGIVTLPVGLGYIKDSVVTDKFKQLFSNNFDAMFDELMSIYPSKVESSNGVRVLHAVDPKAKSNLKARNRYKKVVGNIKEKIKNKINK